MDSNLPSYQSATNRDAWAIIAHYIPSSDLCAASLVCRRWHNLFTPLLWGNPASHFDTENDAVYSRCFDGFLRLVGNPALTEDTSGPHEISQDPQVCQTRSARLDPYALSSACSVGDLWRSASGLAEGDPRLPTLFEVIDGLEVAVF